MIDIQKVFGGKYPISDVTAQEHGFSTLDLARQLTSMGGFGESPEDPGWWGEMQRYLPWLERDPAPSPTAVPTPTTPTSAGMLAPGAPPGTPDVFAQPAPGLGGDVFGQPAPASTQAYTQAGIPAGAVPGWPAKEGWYEHPDWPENVLWHPQYGYHQGGPVYAMISGGEELPVHGPGGTWQEHLPHLVGGTPTPAAPAAPAVPSVPQAPVPTPPAAAATYTAPPGEVVTSPGVYPPTQTEFPFPPEWDIAGRALAQATQATPTQLPPLYTQGAEQALQMAQTGIPTAAPETWGAGEAISKEAAQTGLPTAAPQAWTTAEQAAQQMLQQQGMPVDISGWWEAQQPVFERTIREQAQQAAEEAGLTGLRWSTPLQRQITDITGREAANLWADLAGRDITAQESALSRMMGTVPQLTQLGAGQAQLGEAARARQMAGAGQLYQYGAGRAGLEEAARGRQAAAIPQMLQYAALPAQLEEAARGRALTAAGGLGALGQQYAQLPMNVAAQSMQMGLATQQAQQQQINAILQEFLRTLPETSPWLQLGMQGTTMPFQATPQMYQPSPLSQLLNVGSQVPFMGGQQGFGWWG